MKNIICIHAIVHGKVQGVFYRDATRQQAITLNITGWVKNKNDGTVEVQACGTPDKIDTLIAWLHQGPPRAVVTQVDWEEIPLKNDKKFVVL